MIAAKEIAHDVRKDSGSAGTRIAAALALVPALSGTERGLLVPYLKISDVLVLFIVVVMVVRWRGQWKVGDGLAAILACYAGVAMLATAIQFGRRPELSFSLLPEELLSVSQYALIYLVAYAVGQKLTDPMVFFRWSVRFAAAMSLLAVAQFFNLPFVRQFLASVTGNDRIVNPLEWQVYRGTGLFPSWHALGLYLAVHVAIAAAVLAHSNADRGARREIAIGAALCCAGALTTATATPLVIAFGAVLVFNLSVKRIWVLVPIAVGLISAVIVSPIGGTLNERFARQFEGNNGLLPQTFEYRVLIWRRDFLPIIDEHLWLGYGPLTNDPSVFAYTESMYISVLLRAGLLGLLAFGCFYAAALAGTHRLASSDLPDVSPLARGLRYCLWLLVLGLVIHPYLSDAGGSFLIFALLGLMSGAAWRVDASARRVVGPRVP